MKMLLANGMTAAEASKLYAMTADQIAKLPKHKLATLIQDLMAERAGWQQAVKNRFFRCNGRQCIAVPLTDPERMACREYCDRTAPEQCGNGERVGASTDDAWTEDITCEWWREIIFPQFEGLLIRSSYTSENGCCVEGVWGLMKVT